MDKVVIFTLDGEAWRVYLRAARRVLPTEWNSKGAALAGAQVELRRIANKENFHHDPH